MYSSQGVLGCWSYPSDGKHGGYITLHSHILVTSSDPLNFLGFRTGEFASYRILHKKDSHWNVHANDIFWGFEDFYMIGFTGAGQFIKT